MNIKRQTLWKIAIGSTGDSALELIPNAAAIQPYNPLWDLVDTDGLTDQEWRALYLISEGYTTREAAQILGVKPSTFRTHKQKAIQRLRQQIRQFDLYR